MKFVTALLPLALALYHAANNASLMWVGKTTFGWSPILIDAFWLLLAGVWAVLILRRRAPRVMH